MTPSTFSVALLLVCLAGCVLYTGPINHKPRATITAPAGPFGRGQMISVKATGEDPDGDALHFAWWVVPGACADPPDATRAPDSNVPSPFSFMLPATDATVCVWVQVTDVYGALSDAVQTSITVNNQPPIAVIDVQKPSSTNGFGRYDLYSSFRLSAAASSDPDRDVIKSRTWRLTAPNTRLPTPELVPCSPTSPQDLVVCFDAEAFPGDYVVELVVNDGVVDSAPVQRRLTVDSDHPACVAGTMPPHDASPLVLDPGEPASFAVTSVKDDGAPYPANPDSTSQMTPMFTWSLRRNAGDWQAIVGFEALPGVTLPGGSFSVGDRVDLRVTVSDGVAVHPLIACDPGCKYGCIDNVTWSIEYR